MSCLEALKEGLREVREWTGAEIPTPHGPLDYSKGRFVGVTPDYGVGHPRWW